MPCIKVPNITQIQLVAENIQMNIGSILKGKQLRLLEIVPVIGNLLIEEKDLNTSLSSELLSTALNDVLFKILPEYSLKSAIFWQKIILGNNKITLKLLYHQPANPHLWRLILN